MYSPSNILLQHSHIMLPLTFIAGMCIQSHFFSIFSPFKHIQKVCCLSETSQMCYLQCYCPCMYPESVWQMLFFLYHFFNTHFTFCSLWVFKKNGHCDHLSEQLYSSLICDQDCESLQNLAIVWSKMLIINENLIAGMFHAIVLHMLHHCIFVDFLGPTEGLKHCYIAYKDWLFQCISTHFSGYVYLSTIVHVLWTAMISFFSTEGKEYHSMLQSHVSWCLVTFLAISTIDNCYEQF